MVARRQNALSSAASAAARLNADSAMSPAESWNPERFDPLRRSLGKART